MRTLRSACPAVRLAIVVVLLLAVPVPVGAADAPSEAEKLFALKVRPLLQEKCLGCHGREPEQLESGFDIRTREGLLAGGELYGEEVLRPGKAEESILYAMVTRTDPDYAMPPKEAEKLTEEETWWVRDWINGGAPWPNDERVAEIYKRFASGVLVKTSGGLSSEWTNRKYDPANLWAYQPLKRTDVPADVNPVDYFIDASLAEKGIQPAPTADRRTLLRRAVFDLLGLPPTPKQMEQFLSDERDDQEAFEALVDRLLSNRHYGEQWGRHWLDVVRYADSGGFANDWERPNAWRYRDYVIRSFNSDKPYDQFVREQLAGDEIAPDSSEHLIAAGFLRMGPWEQTGMSVAKVTRQQFLDDITDSVGQVFLAHPLQCCRCHDHKFDPLPTRDYYSIQSVFATTQFAEVDADWLPEENLSGMESDHAQLTKRIESNNKLLASIPKPRKSPNDYGRERIGRKWRTRFAWEMDRYKPLAYTVFSGDTKYPRNVNSRLKKPAKLNLKARPPQTHILTGGDVFSPGEPVDPGVISAAATQPVSLPASISGRRAAFAEWVVDESNPLTARVMVNRVWQYHFGRGIAGNPNNFGATGKKPTHPELLDWLADDFIAHGWSVKHLHRRIMNSDAYRRSPTHPNPQQLEAADPLGVSYAVATPRRLAAEEIRDAMLAASGELNRRLGGIPSRPDMNLEAALQPRMIMGTFAPSYTPHPRPEDRNRRSIYALKLRGHRDPFFETFNQPGSERSCELRDSSTVTPQALTLLNGQETNDRALALAARVLKETAGDRAAIERLFQLAYARPAEPEEVRAALDHWETMTEVEAKIDYQRMSPPREVVREANEENTGETFTFTERLFAYDDYESDLQPCDVDARTRGLANVCLAVLNSNEFLYVY